MTTNYILLLTSTINPGLYTSSVSRNNPEVRTSDYLSALNFWENLGDHRITGIVFCDNSGANIEYIKESCKNFKLPIEFLVFDGNTKPDGVHYGYSELGIIDYAIINSNKIDKSSYFIKVTGRLKYPNISKLLDTLPKKFDAAVDHRKRYRNENGYILRARTQLMIFNLHFYIENLLQKRQEMPGKFSHIEEFIAIKLNIFSFSHIIIQRFKTELLISGVSGNKNENYNNFKNKIKFSLRKLVRYTTPSIWI